jgi:hypothetical protein
MDGALAMGKTCCIHTFLGAVMYIIGSRETGLECALRIIMSVLTCIGLLLVCIGAVMKLCGVI